MGGAHLHNTQPPAKEGSLGMVLCGRPPLHVFFVVVVTVAVVVAVVAVVVAVVAVVAVVVAVVALAVVAGRAVARTRAARWQQQQGH